MFCKHKLSLAKHELSIKNIPQSLVRITYVNTLRWHFCITPHSSKEEKTLHLLEREQPPSIYPSRLCFSTMKTPLQFTKSCNTSGVSSMSSSFVRRRQDREVERRGQGLNVLEDLFL